jgi:hypothetical protein
MIRTESSARLRIQDSGFRIQHDDIRGSVFKVSPWLDEVGGVIEARRRPF